MALHSKQGDSSLAASNAAPATVQTSGIGNQGGQIEGVKMDSDRSEKRPAGQPKSHEESKPSLLFAATSAKPFSDLPSSSYYGPLVPFSGASTVFDDVPPGSLTFSPSRSPHAMPGSPKAKKRLFGSKKLRRLSGSEGKDVAKKEKNKGKVLARLASPRPSLSLSTRTISPPTSPISPVSPISPTSPVFSPTMSLSGGGPLLEEADQAEFSPEPSALKRNEKGEFEVTPQDRHYLNRMLVNLQLQRELGSLSQIGTLAKYGDPFLPHANGPCSRPSSLAPLHKTGGSGFLSFLGGGTAKEQKDPQFEGYVWDEKKVGESPLCQYLFWRFIHNAPALCNAKPNYWSDLIQPFFDSFAEKDLSSTVERGEITKRRMLTLGVVRLTGSYVSSSIRSIGPASPARPSRRMMSQVDLLVPGNMNSYWRILRPGSTVNGAWVAVADAKEEGGEWVFHILVRPLNASRQKAVSTFRPWSTLVVLFRTLTSLDPDNRLSLPYLPDSHSSSSASKAQVQRYLRALAVSLAAPPTKLEGSSRLQAARAEVERFLLHSRGGGQLDGHQLLELIQQVEEEDARDEERHQRWVGVGERVKRLRTAWVRYRHALIHGHELDKSYDLMKKFVRVDQLPQEYQDAEEWGMLYFAYAMHYIFVAAKTGPEMINIMKSFHELIPYAAVKVGLNIVNPTLAIKAVVHLILGQPAGQQSLFQRIWHHICVSANRHQQALIDSFRKKVDNEALCDKLKEHVEAKYVDRQKTKATAIKRDEDILLTIFRERGDRKQYKLVEGWHANYARDDKLAAYDDTQQSEGARRFADLKELLAAYYRYRDRMQVHAIAVESPLVPKMMHQTIAIFYDAIRAVANASRLGDRVADFQAFLDDLVKTCENGTSKASDFINLVERHHQKMYFFAHEVTSTNPTLINPLNEYCRSIFTLIRDGVPSASPPSSSSPSPRAGTDTDALLSSLPPKEQAKVLSESRDFARWIAYMKAEKDIRMRCDLLAASSSSTFSSSSFAQTDKLYASLLAQSPPDLLASLRSAAERQKETGERTGPGGDLEWAWWASKEEVGGAAGRGIVKAHAESAKAALAASASSGAATSPRPRDASESATAKEDGYSVLDFKATFAAAMQEGSDKVIEDAEKLAMPTPHSEGIQGLVSRWLKQVKGSLKAAKEGGAR
ncbi:hypothetical protein JCM11641_005020 [Rhodosporidiobolus odoratus]